MKTAVNCNPRVQPAQGDCERKGTELHWLHVPPFSALLPGLPHCLLMRSIDQLDSADSPMQSRFGGTHERYLVKTSINISVLQLYKYIILYFIKDKKLVLLPNSVEIQRKEVKIHTHTHPTYVRHVNKHLVITILKIFI